MFFSPVYTESLHLQQQKNISSMKKQILASLLLSLVTFTGLSAQTLFSIEENWENVTDRSQTAPSLSIDNDKLLISSDKAIDGLLLLIKDSQGQLLYQETIQLPADFLYPVFIGQLQPGTYYIELRHENEYKIYKIYWKK